MKRDVFFHFLLNFLSSFRNLTTNIFRQHQYLSSIDVLFDPDLAWYSDAIKAAAVETLIGLLAAESSVSLFHLLNGGLFFFSFQSLFLIFTHIFIFSISQMSVRCCLPSNPFLKENILFFQITLSLTLDCNLPLWCQTNQSNCVPCVFHDFPRYHILHQSLRKEELFSHKSV